MTVSICPIWNGTQFFDNGGLPLNGGQIFQYQAGSTSIQEPTYADSLGTIENANPIVLDSSGRIPVEMYLTNGVAYQLVLTLSDGTTVLAFVDNIIGVQSVVSGGNTGNAVWNAIADAPTFVNVNTFVIPNNYVTEFAVGNRVQAAYDGTYFTYGTVSAVIYSSPNTQVTLVNDSTVLNSGMTAVLWSIGTVAGPIVDSGGVTYQVPSNYTTTFTAGYQIKTLNTAVGVLSNRILDTYVVIPVSGSPNYTGLADPLITTYTVGQRFTLAFAGGSGSAATVDINGIGVVSLFQYTSAGALVNPIISAGMVSDIAYDGTYFILLDQLPASPFIPGAIPHGTQTYTVGVTPWTCPAGVNYVQVLCVGGGGGGGSGYTFTTGGEGGTTTYFPGGDGGGGGSAFNVVAVTPGNTYAISIGIAGTGGSYSGGGAGGVTTFGSGGGLCSATGGSGGPYGLTTPGASGICSVGQFGWYSVGTNGFQVAGGTKKGCGGAGDYACSGIGSVGYAGMITIWW